MNLKYDICTTGVLTKAWDTQTICQHISGLAQVGALDTLDEAVNAERAVTKHAKTEVEQNFTYRAKTHI